MRRLLILSLLGIAVAGAARAQSLPDPTRPPAGIMAVPGDSSSSMMAPSGPQLQSVILREGAKPRALINGEWLEVGQRSGDSKIVKIAADRVEIKGAQGRQTLRLTPDVAKQTPKPHRGTQTQEKTK